MLNFQIYVLIVTILWFLYCVFSSSSTSSSEYSVQGQVLHSQAQEPRLQFCRKQVLQRTLSNQECKFYQGLNRCSSFPLLSTSHSLSTIWTDLKSSEKIPGALTWKWGEWIWRTGPSWLHRNSPQELNISCIRVFDQIRDPEIPILRPPPHFN